MEAFLSRLTWPNFAPTLLGTTEVVPGYRASILIAWEYVPNDRPLKDGTRRANRDNAARAAAALAGLTDDARRDVPDMLPAPAFRPAAGRVGG